jgi:hypothetical protein
MNQVVCCANSLKDLISQINLYIEKGYFVNEGSFQVLNTKVSKIGGDEYKSEYLCIVEREFGDMISVFNQYIHVLDPYDVVKEGDFRIEKNKFAEVPLLFVDEIAGDEIVFRVSNVVPVEKVD